MMHETINHDTHLSENSPSADVSYSKTPVADRDKHEPVDTNTTMPVGNQEASEKPRIPSDELLEGSSLSSTLEAGQNLLREFRIEQMMSKAELARKAGLSVLTVDRIEKGYGCRMDTKRKLLKALGLKT